MIWNPCSCQSERCLEKRKFPKHIRKNGLDSCFVLIHCLTSEIQFQCMDVTVLESILICNLSSLFIRELLHCFFQQIFHIHQGGFISISLMGTQANQQIRDKILDKSEGLHWSCSGKLSDSSGGEGRNSLTLFKVGGGSCWPQLRRWKWWWKGQESEYKQLKWVSFLVWLTQPEKLRELKVQPSSFILRKAIWGGSGSWPGCLPSFRRVQIQATPRTHWRDNITPLAWEHLRNPLVHVWVEVSIEIGTQCLFWPVSPP